MDDLGGEGGAGAEAFADELPLLGGVGAGLFGQAGGALGLGVDSGEGVARDGGQEAQGLAAYRAALEEWTRERVPLDWAMTQNNLGTALATGRFSNKRSRPFATRTRCIGRPAMLSTVAISRSAWTPFRRRSRLSAAEWVFKTTFCR